MNTTHIANPVRVNARQIKREVPRDNGEWHYELSDGTVYQPEAGMLARYLPRPGDYLVTQEDGYEYFNPKDVFERKYSVIEQGRPCAD